MLGFQSLDRGAGGLLLDSLVATWQRVTPGREKQQQRCSAPEAAAQKLSGRHGLRLYSCMLDEPQMCFSGSFGLGDRTGYMRIVSGADGIPPHPNPLPKERENLRLCYHMLPLRISARGNLAPSPWGEGWGEGNGAHNYSQLPPLQLSRN